jgi:PAS domain S-box-containing protein/excisionase family DNA binding protein
VFLSTGEAARRCGFSRHTLLRAARRGDLPPAWRTPGGNLRFRAADVAAFAAGLTMPVSSPGISLHGGTQGPEAEASGWGRLVELSPDLMCVAGSDGYFKWVNPAFTAVLGWSSEELLARPYAEFLHPEDRAGTAAAATPRAGAPVHAVENRYRCADGSWRWISWITTPSPEEGLHYGVGRDITERRQLEEAVRESEQRFRLAFNEPSTGMALAAPDGRLLEVNQALCRMLGYTERELLDLRTPVLTHPDDIAASRERIDQLLAGEIPSATLEKRYLHKQGQVIWTYYTASLLRAVDGRPLYFVYHLQDITGRKHAEHLLEERNRELALANRELEAFSYSVSHDLRAPLRAISGFSRIVLEDHADNLDETGREYLREVIGASAEMGRLIDDLLRLSRVTSADLQLEPTDLSVLAREVATSLAKRTPERLVSVVIAKSLEGQGDARLLRVVLDNLLGNAWKFTRVTPAARIEVGVTERGGRPAYFVRDNGAGFNMAYAAKLFGAFQRLHSAKEFEGTGVGLATVQRIIHRHGGEVWAEAEVGRGATFYFTLGRVADREKQSPIVMNDADSEGLD